MDIRETKSFLELPKLAENYYNKKVSKVKVIKDGIKMEISLNKKEKVCFTVSSFSKEKFNSMKSTVFNNLGKLSNSLGIENKFAERKAETLANKEAATEVKAMAKANKKIVIIKYVEHKTATEAAETVGKQMKKLAAQITINSIGLTGTEESVAKQKLNAYFSLVELSDNDMEKIQYLEAAANVVCSINDNQLRARTYNQLGELYEHWVTYNKDDAIEKAKKNYFFALIYDNEDTNSLKGYGRIAQKEGESEIAVQYFTREFKLLQNDPSSIKTRTKEIYSGMNGKEILKMVVKNFEREPSSEQFHNVIKFLNGTITSY